MTIIYGHNTDVGLSLFLSSSSLVYVIYCLKNDV